MRSLRLSMLACAVTVLCVAACGIPNEARLGGRSSAALCSSGSIALAIRSTGPVPAGCVKIEGSQIGQAPQTLSFSGITLTITGWTDKDGQPGEQVGFTFTSSAPVLYAVKASTRTFADSATSWVHPEGTSGPAANGISNITFCPGEETDGGTLTPDDGGTDVGVDGGGGGGGECDPDSPDIGAPCVTTPDCATDLTCVQGVCTVVIN